MLTAQASCAAINSERQGSQSNSSQINRDQFQCCKEILIAHRTVPCDTANLSARMSYHATRGRRLVGYVCGLTYDECRILEQLGMAYFHSILRGDPVHNQIRGVATTKMERYLQYALALANSGLYPEDGVFPLSYLNNQLENEFLNRNR